MKKNVIIITFLFLFSIVNAKGFLIGPKADFTSGAPIQLNGDTGIFLRNEISPFFSFDQSINVGFSLMMISETLYSLTLSHAFYPTFRFGGKNVFFTFTTPGPVFRLIPYEYYIISLLFDKWQYMEYSSLFFAELLMGLSMKISLEIQLNDKVIFSPVSLQAELLYNILANINDGRIKGPVFTGGYGMYLLFRIN